MPPPPPELQPTSVTQPPPPPQHVGDHITPAMQPAMEYVTRIKQRFTGHADLYEEFLDILNQYKGPAVDEVCQRSKVYLRYSDYPSTIRPN